MSDYQLTDEPYGFKWGPMVVSRCISDERIGVVVTIQTKCNREVNIRVTPGGQIRIGRVGKRVLNKSGSWFSKGAEIP